MFLIAGLGNPGREYAGNRHNIGFLAIDALIARNRLLSAGQKFSSLLLKGNIAGHEVVAIKPQTFMNRSGIAVGEAARFYKIPPANILVIHDELDLETGRAKVKQGGGHGGHNGLKDIDRAIGQDYRRVRLGIGHPGIKEGVTSHVLNDFSPDEWRLEEALIDAVARHFALLLQGEDAKFMNAVALDTKASS